MKKIILLFTISLLGIVTAFGQSLSLSTDDGDIPNGAILNFSGGAEEALVAEVYITNDSDESKDVLIKKVYIDTVPGSENMFCWAGSCYGPDVFVSPNFATIPSGGTNTEFDGDYNPLNTEGITTIMYVWFDKSNTEDTVYVIVNFNTKADKKLELSGPDGSIISDGSVSFEGGLDLVETDKIRILNFRDEVIDVKVKKIINDGDTIAGTENGFYWDMEYGMEQYESDAVPFASMETFYDFKGIYHPNENEGISTITYEFFDINDNTNKVIVEVEYDAKSSQGIENQNTLVDFSYAYPNPANNQVSFTYELDREVNDAVIVISNLLGSVVKERRIDKNHNSLTIQTGDFRDGLYLYSVKIDGKVEFTRKLIVKH